jgi:hypothetical protein
MINGTFTPCHSCRLKSGAGAFSIAATALTSRGCTVIIGSTPTSRQAPTSTSTGMRIHTGGSCGVFSTSSGRSRKNTSWMKRSE